jgi:hypothetical protein
MIIPVCCFHDELLLCSNTSSGHAINFCSDGPIQVTSTTSPVIDPEQRPRVTFLGPIEAWRKEQ